jgi:hypothetical protein
MQLRGLQVELENFTQKSGHLRTGTTGPSTEAALQGATCDPPIDTFISTRSEVQSTNGKYLLELMVTSETKLEKEDTRLSLFTSDMTFK